MASHVCSKCADSYESEYIDELCPACRANQPAQPEAPCPNCTTYDDGVGILSFCPLHEHAAALLASCLTLLDIVHYYEQEHGISGIDASFVHDAKIATLNAQGKREEGYNV